MRDNLLVVINNDKISEENNNFFCNNYNLKIIPEELNNYHKVKYIARRSNKKGRQKINLKDIDIASNIFKFIYFIFSTFQYKNSKYLIISINPYTFISFLILFLFRKKIYIYLISNGHEEWKYILGSWSVWIYHIMYSIITSKSEVITLHEKLYKGKNCHLVTSSTLDEKWFKNFKEAKLDKVKFLYVGRTNPEKGVYQFLEMFEKAKLNAEFSIVGNHKKLRDSKNKEIQIIGYVSDKESLIDIYDNHNILILPSFTEGQPHVVEESLARRRPVIIFEEIKHIINDRKGIFVSKRNVDTLIKTTNYVMQNYNEIQEDIKKNKFPLKEDMIKEISGIINL